MPTYDRYDNQSWYSKSALKCGWQDSDKNILVSPGRGRNGKFLVLSNVCGVQLRFAAVRSLNYCSSGTGGGSTYASTCIPNKAFKARSLNTGMNNNQQQNSKENKQFILTLRNKRSEDCPSLYTALYRCHEVDVTWMNLMREGDCVC